MTPAVSRIAFYRNPDTPRRFAVPPVCTNQWTENDWLQTRFHFPEPTPEEMRALINPRRLAIMREHYPELTHEQHGHAIAHCTHADLPFSMVLPILPTGWNGEREAQFLAVSVARQKWGEVIRLLYPYDPTDPFNADPDYAIYRDLCQQPQHRNPRPKA